MPGSPGLGTVEPGRPANRAHMADIHVDAGERDFSDDAPAVHGLGYGMK